MMAESTVAPITWTESKALQRARQKARARLKQLNIKLHGAPTNEHLVAAIEVYGMTMLKRECLTDYYNRFDESFARSERYVPKFRPLKPRLIPHLRQAEIDALPDQISVSGRVIESLYSRRR